jgi:hypothetical protein
MDVTRFRFSPKTGCLTVCLTGITTPIVGFSKEFPSHDNTFHQVCQPLWEAESGD